MDWLEVARALPLGRKTRAVCPMCGDKTMLASHDERGFSAYCFRDGNIGFEKHGYMNLEQLSKMRELNALAADPQQEEMPDADDIIHCPSAWLATAGIGAQAATRAGFGWSRDLERVVFPITATDPEGDTWQARAVLPGQYPKYIGPSGRDKGLYLYVPRRKPSAGTVGRETVCVVTEDWLSAQRVHGVADNVLGCTILGTKLSTAQASRLHDYHAAGARIVFWLDPDKAGRDGTDAAQRILGLIGVDMERVDSEVDPKLCTARQICGYLGVQHVPRYRIY